ncbi:MAG: acyl-CoA thioester hydrolase/BAAT C-terminal domain-containing protein [Nocardioides sp.]
MSRIETEILRPGGSGVHGTMFIPVDTEPEVAALIIGGSGGNEPILIAEHLAHEGIPALSVAYFGHENLPPDLSEIDLNYFQTALALLAARLGNRRVSVAVVGQSRGSEAAMLTALLFSDLIDAVVVAVPSNLALCGFPSGGPAWIHNGVALPYSNEFGPECANPEAVFATELVDAPILFASAGVDEVWPSAPMARAMAKRRRAHSKQGGDLLLEYPEATHSMGYLCPDLPAGLAHSDPPLTRAARADVWPRVVRFIQGVAARGS